MLSSKNETRPVAALFNLGLAIGLVYLPVSLEISVTLNPHSAFVHSLLLFVLPVGFSFMGLGALAERALQAVRPADFRGNAATRLAGALMLLFLFTALRFTFFASTLPGFMISAALNLFSLCGWFFAAGFAVARQMRSASQRPGSALGWAVHSAGLLAGYAAAIPAVNYAGANAVLACVGAAMAVAPAIFPALLFLGLAASSLLPVDSRLETARDTAALSRGAIWGETFVSGKPLKRLLRLNPGDEVIFRKWSRFSLVSLVRQAGADGKAVISGYYNFVKQFEFPADGSPGGLRSDNFRRLTYSRFKKNDRLFVAAVGPGRGLDCLPFSPAKNITAVEQDDALAMLLTEKRPELNRRLFHRVNFIRGDARRALENLRGPFDGIILESAFFNLASAGEPAGTPKTLYTREAIALYLSKLSENGMLVIVLNNVVPEIIMEYLAVQSMRALDEAGAWHHEFYIPGDRRPGVSVLIAASKDRETMNAFRTGILSGGEAGGVKAAAWKPATGNSPVYREPLTDDRPFSRWITMGSANKKAIFANVLLLLLLSAAPVAAALGGRSPLCPSLAVFFFLLGAAHTAMLSSSVLVFRSYFGDSVVTLLRVAACYLACGTLGGLIAHKRSSWLFSPAAAFSVPAVLALHGLIPLFLPFSAPPFWRETYGIAAILPGGLLMGMLFPAGLLLCGGKGIAAALFFDALGSMAGYMFYYLVCLPLGITAYMWTALAIYGAAFIMFRFSGGGKMENQGGPDLA